MRLGAYGFIDKTEPIERLVQEIENAVSRGRMVASCGRCARASTVTRHSSATARRCAPCVTPGRAGRADSEQCADHRRQRHWQGARGARAASSRAGREEPARRRSTAALPEQLVESELFGHERGAFTGADRLSPRRENAGGSTLLDEVGELPLYVAGEGYRVLEDRKVSASAAIGRFRSRRASWRLIVISNAKSAGRFRQDLLYRLNIHTLRVPPLRDRLSDIPAIVDHLLQSIASHLRRAAEDVAPDAVALLAAHDWRKNNVRELSNVLERMMIASDTAVITVAEVPPDIRGDDRDDADDPSAAPGTFKAMKAQAERQIVVAALEKHNWHVTKTAEALGLADHSSLLKIMRRHGLSRSS